MQDLSKTNKANFYIKRIIGLILLLSMAAVFLFSGISKLYAFEPFIWNIMDAGISSMTIAAVLARLFIGFEILLGLFLIAHLFLKSFTYPVIIALLSVFTIYLILLISRQGNNGNCGCFGDAYFMKPSAAIIKNLIMMVATFILIKLYPIKSYKNAEWIAVFLGMAAIVAPFIFYPLSADSTPQDVNRTINLSPLYHSTNLSNRPPDIDLTKGKHVIAFMSLTCPHCKKAAFLIHILHRQHPDIPFFLVLNGHPDFEKDFFKETRAEAVPHMLFRGGEEFQSMAGPAVPAIFWINNGTIEKESNYFQLDPKYLEAWVHDGK